MLPKPSKKSSAPHRSGRVALIGRPNVGKSTLLNALLGEKIAITSHHPQTTRDRILGVIHREDAQIALVDTPGLHAAKNKLGARMNAEAKDVAVSADVVVCVVDVGREPKAEVDPRDAIVLAQLPENSSVVLVVNKIDRVKPKELLLPALEAYGRARDFAAILPMSAKTSDGVERLLSVLAELVPEGESLYEEDTLTDRPVRFFAAELVREAVLQKTREEVPHGVACVVETFAEPTGKKKMTEISVAIHVAKDTHKKIVVGRAGALIKEIGTAARTRIEELIGSPVLLKTHVRVTPEWFDRDDRLRELGYGETTTKADR
jgi:GTP-binding protein Era